ncbi:diaminopimelate epimerase [Paracrocinitomix mangrovi]|uniref:diaminopimelate epimerase n=1 Tax=Paracrocinitomix mangrovi TaxID=2862509 RepID=UPI001C8DB4B4|nr:diaminopimelate epimerase [Paracrocinitomix mangrovi]UKN01847.1 diaminopimelate epimerase [Paracrocinitomix mangrovi]
MIEFYKFHGAGNDFILIDNRSLQFNGDKVAFAQKWCSRRFGVGSDGIIFIENQEGVDFNMDFYNPDGSQSFCGNGSRCAVAFAKLIGVGDGNFTFKAIDGIHQSKFKDNLYHILMSDVNGIEKIGNDYFMHTGSPHYISYCGSSDQRDIVEFGREIRYSDKYKAAGTNVNLVKFISDNKIDLRTYERGVEDETFACGTGATAAALVSAFVKQLNDGEIAVKVKGGDLKVQFERNNDTFKNVWLIGPAQFVFKGIIND